MQAESLFREKTTAQVRDYNLQISLDITKIKDQFNKQLGERYGEILEVTDEVKKLLVQSKDVDSQLMELCFNDEKYKLESISEARVKSRRNSITQYHDKIDIGNTKWIMTVTNWIQAVKDFIRDPSLSKNFDNVLSKFETIMEHPDCASYADLISKYCHRMENHILDDKPSFTPLQWVKLYNLFHHTSSRFDFQKIKQIEHLTFESLLANDDLVHKPNASALDPLVQDFLSSAAFKSKLIAKFVDDTNEQMEAYINSAHESTEDISLYNIDAGKDLFGFVQNVNLYYLGLTRGRDKKLYALVENVVASLRSLKTFGTDEAITNSIKEKVINLLKEEEEKRQETVEDVTADDKEINSNPDKEATEQIELPVNLEVQELIKRDDTKNSDLVEETVENHVHNEISLPEAGEDIEKGNAVTKKTETKTEIDLPTESTDARSLVDDIHSSANSDAKSESEGLTNAEKVTTSANSTEDYVGSNAQEQETNERSSERQRLEITTNDSSVESGSQSNDGTQISGNDSVEQDSPLKATISSTDFQTTTGSIATLPHTVDVSGHEPMIGRTEENMSDGHKEHDSLHEATPPTHILVEKLIECTNRKRFIQFLHNNIELVNSL